MTRLPVRIPSLAGALSAASLVAVLAVPPAAGQIPEEFTNLQVLPEDVSRGQLIGTMRSFSIGLGLRCNNCHVGEPGQPLSEYDFAADDKPLKEKARAMIRMVQAINGEYLANLPNRRGEGIEVTCATCHGGVRRPEAIAAIVVKVAQEDGVHEAADRYRDLRERYYGSRAYDFGERPLIDAAERLVQGGDAAGAVSVLELNLEFHPESWQSMTAAGQVLDRSGDPQGAASWYRRSLEIQPRQPPVQRRLEEIGG